MRAFTLFELLVAMVMTVIIAGLLSASVYTGFHAQASAQRAAAANDGIDAAMDTLVADLGNAAPAQSATATTLAGPFQGNNQSLNFSAYGMEPGADVEPGTEIQGNMRLIEIYCVHDPDGIGLQLVRSVTTNLLSPVQATPVTEVLCDHVESFTLSYFDGTNWDNTWDSTQTQPANELPLAVGLNLVLIPAAGDPPIQQQRIVPLACAQLPQGLNLP